MLRLPAIDTVMRPWQPYLLIAVGGALGAVARFAMAETVTKVAGAGFPWGTLAVNVAGSFLLGMLGTYLALEVSTVPEFWRYGLGMGFLGAFTTFSTFAFENDLMWTSGEWLKAGLYISLSVFVGLAAVRVGALVVDSLA